MTERQYRSDGRRAEKALGGVVLPVALLLIVIAVVSGLVVGGVIQGEAERTSGGPSTTTGPTIIIGP